jgi:hypothetical protein
MSAPARDRATAAQRAGMLLAFVEACGFGFVAWLHFGFAVELRGTRFAAPFSYPAAIVETVLALVLLIALVVPGGGSARAGRVLIAQILVVICVFAGQVVGVSLATRHGELFYIAALVLALASIALVALPATRRRFVPG